MKRRERRHAAVTSRAQHPVRTAVVIALVAVLGVAIMLYPSAASWFSQLEQSRRIGAYSQHVDALDAAARATALRDARDYNARLSSGAVADPFTQQPLTAQDAAAVQAYAEILSLGPDEAMARIRFPLISVDLPVYHGTSDETLERGVGHLMGTAVPVGGAGTHTVLTGHRGLPQSTLFTDLDKAAVGDIFEIEVYGEVLSYAVTEAVVVDPDDTESLRPVAGKDLVTLVTCTPIGINDQRILVTGTRIPTPDEDAVSGAASDLPGFPWWAVWMLLAIAAADVYVFSVARSARRRGESPLVASA